MSRHQRNPPRAACLPVVLALLWLALFTTPTVAQLLRPNAEGMTMGHVLLNVRDVDAHRAFWVEQFDARPVTVGTLEGVTMPGIVVLFRRQDPTGPGEGETINHMGLKVRRLDEYLRGFTEDGWRFDRPRIGRETTPQTYVTGPEGFRMELVQDSTLPVPAITHHLHYWLPDTAAVKRWYVEKLRLEPTLRSPYPSGDVPGMSLTFAPLGSQAVPGVPTRGRLMDSIGFEIVELRVYCEGLKARGVTLEKEYGPDPELGINSATLTDPWGVTIRLTEGLDDLAGITPFTYIDRYITPSPIR